jgi:Methyltransferase domain
MNFLSRKSIETDYYELLTRIHAFLKPRTYVEIGIRQGHSLRLAKSAAARVGIDPAPALEEAPRRGTQVFAMTSDDFFARHNLPQELGGRPVDLAFVDGMHLFEFALRDFANLEKYCHRDSTILVHDCYPVDRASAARERTTQIWSGDVWKLIVCLKKYRPDLHICTVDVPPTGLGIIRRLDPHSTTLSSLLDRLYDEFVPYDYGQMEPDKAQQLNRVENRWNEIKSLLSAPACAAP